VRVGGDRTSEVAGTETLSVGQGFKLDLGGGAAGISVTSDRRIVLSTGEASIVLDGPHIFLDGQAAVQLSGGEAVSIGGAAVPLDGGPNVYLNAGSAAAPGPVAAIEHAAEKIALEALPSAEERVLSHLLSSPVEAPGAAPEAIAVPAHI